MSLFPTYLEEQEIETNAEEIKPPKEYEIDFATGRITGRIVEGLEAIKVWVWLAIQTVRYRYIIYSWDYGNELEDLIGSGYSEEHIQSEAERIITETMIVNENIQSISEVEVTLSENKISASFKINTLYGEANINV